MTEILYVVKGKAIQHINERIFTISKGDIVIIRSKDIHATYSDTFTEIDVYQFGNDYFSESEKWIFSNFEIFNEDLLIDNPICTFSAFGIEILDMLNSIKKEYSIKGIGWEIAVFSLYLILIRKCMKQYPQKKVVKKTIIEAKKFLKIVFKFIDENYMDKIYLEDAVKLTQYSIPQFSRIFKKNVGMTFFEYLNHYRIMVSLNLVSEDMSITEIAYECGFSSVNSFIRAFKNQIGISPGKYRKHQDKPARFLH